MLAIPPALITAGLVGCALSLIVATAQQKWQLKAFFLLTLRLAIGWQFLFEGMYKINSHLAGPMENNKEFSSEMYFKVSPTAMGGEMRSKFTEPLGNYYSAEPKDLERIRDNLKSACPGTVAAMLDKTGGAANATLDRQVADAKRDLGGNLELARNDDLKNFYQQQFEEKLKAIEDKRAKLGTIDPKLLDDAKTKYALWAVGLEGRDTKIKSVNGDVALTAPQRFTNLQALKDRIRAEEAKLSLGNCNGVQTKLVSELKIQAVNDEADLVKDAKAFVNELRKGIVGFDVVDAPVESEGKQLDAVTMWFIAIVGACILFGLFTRTACVFAAGFLLVTYLTHPPFPWYTLPPATEGNPLFVNKNLIEMFALLALACYPTGRWLGLDAIVALCIPCCRRKNCDL